MALQDEYSTNLGLSVLPEFEQSKHPEIWGELMRLRAALKILQGALDTYTGALPEDPQYWTQTSPNSSVKLSNLTRVYCTVNDTITPGQTVSLINNTGTLTAVRANATDNTKPCRAFSAGTYNPGDNGQFILMGIIPYFSGMTPGTKYYLATTSGQFTSTAPAVVGNVVQEIGYVLTPTTMFFNPVLNWKQL